MAVDTKGKRQQALGSLQQFCANLLAFCATYDNFAGMYAQNALTGTFVDASAGNPNATPPVPPSGGDFGLSPSSFAHLSSADVAALVPVLATLRSGVTPQVIQLFQKWSA